MIIQKNIGCLWVTSGIHFDDNTGFCGLPYVSLVANKNERFYTRKPYTITISVHDDDDFDIGLMYHSSPEQFHNVLHELINWMHDHEKGISSFRRLWEMPMVFFPDCGCERTYW